jgi:hypothetical protein
MRCASYDDNKMPAGGLLLTSHHWRHAPSAPNRAACPQIAAHEPGEPAGRVSLVTWMPTRPGGGAHSR